jgi:hypothetical protein
MIDAEEMKLKNEIDEIMRSVDMIMQKVEKVLPAKKDDSQAQNE